MRPKWRPPPSTRWDAFRTVECCHCAYRSKKSAQLPPKTRPRPLLERVMPRVARRGECVGIVVGFGVRGVGESGCAGKKVPSLII
jgi:hypothetical protein